MKGWFFIDAGASFPYAQLLQYILFPGEDTSDIKVVKTPSLLRMLKIIRILRVVRLLRVMKLKKLMYKVQEYVVTDTLNMMVDFAKIFLGMFFFSHWIACSFFYIANF